MKISKTKCLLAVLTALVGLSLQQAQAHLEIPTYYTLPTGLGNPAGETAFVNSETGTTQTYLNKSDNPGSNPGVWDNSGAVDSSHFNVTYNFTGTDALTATISWDLTGTGFLLNYVLVKDGSAPGGGAFYYALYPVSADEGLMGSGTVQVNANASRNISHISFFGTEGGTVPDGGTTAALLGLGLSGLAALRAKFGRN
jgi:hypothetical protein